MTKHTQPKHTYTRQQLAFIVGTGIIGVAFLAAIALVLSGQFKPSASEVSTSTPGAADAVTLTITDGKMTYQNQAGQEKSVTANDLTLTKESDVMATVTLQGLGTKHDKVTSLNGEMTVLKNGGSINNPNDVIVRKVAWASAKAVDANAKLQVTFNSDDVLTKIAEANATGPFEIHLKPKNYLGVKLQNVTDFSTVLAFPEAPVGDLFDETDEDYNFVNDRDFSVFTANREKPTPGDNNPADFNRDGKIDTDDYTTFIGNLGRKGEGL